MNIESHQALDIYDVSNVEVELQERRDNSQMVLYVHVDGMTVLRVLIPSTATHKVKLPRDYQYREPI